MTAIQWISKEAKAIRKKHPSFAWSQCIKKASANYKAKHKTTTTKKKVGAVKYVEKGEPKSAKAKKVYQVNRTKKGTFKSVTRIAGTTTHKDTKSHNVNVRVVSGIGKKIGNIPQPNDIDAVREIEIFIENDYQLYRSQTNPILINLTKKFKKGTFDINKASKLFRYLIDSGMKKYHKEYGTGKDWHKLLSTHDRQYLAEQMAKHTLIELQSGNEWN